MSRKQFAGSFVQGLLAGYQMESDRQRQKKLDEQDRAERAQRSELIGLQIGNARRDSERQATMQSADDQIRKSAVVGMQVYSQPGKKEGETEDVYKVGEQTFADRGEAEKQLKTLNTPLAVARRQYEAAASSGIPELAQRYRENHNTVQQQTQAELNNGAMEAVRSGPMAVNKFFNERVLNGTTEQLTMTPDGKIVTAQYQGGKRVSEPMTYSSQEEYVASHLARFQSSPQQYLETFQRNQKMGEERRQFDATLAQTQRYQDGQLGVGRMNAQASQASAGASMLNARTGQERLGIERAAFEAGAKEPKPSAVTRGVGANAGKTMLHFNTPGGVRTTTVDGVPPSTPMSMSEMLPPAAAAAGPSGAYQVPQVSEEELAKRIQALRSGGIQ